VWQKAWMAAPQFAVEMVVSRYLSPQDHSTFVVTHPTGALPYLK